MKRLVLACALVAAQALPAGTQARAQKPSPQITIDPATSTLGIGGWDRSVATTGTVYYRCQAQECGPGSLLSVRKAAERPTKAGLEANAREIARVMGQRLGPSARIVVGDAQATGSDAAGMSFGRITLDFHDADPGAGIPPAWTNGFVAGPRAAFTVSSSAANRDLADRNLEAFKPGLAILAAWPANTPDR